MIFNPVVVLVTVIPDVIISVPEFDLLLEYFTVKPTDGKILPLITETNRVMVVSFVVYKSVKFSESLGV